MSHRTIISPSELNDLMRTHPDLVVLDARFNLDDESWGDRAFAESRIPGALRADLARELAGPIIEGRTGRRPFPSPEEFEATVRAWGITPQSQVVVYDADRGLMAASRAWVMLRWLGHDDVAVLDGGWPAWISAGLDLESGDPHTPTASDSFTAHLRPALLAEVDEVDIARTELPTRVFDSRGAEGYHGQGKYYDPVRGHIKGAGLADRAETMNSDGTFRSPEELRAHYSSLIGTNDSSDVIFYCGSGVTAAQNVLAMEIAGLPGARMYVGSWSEWILDPAREVET